jgi:hypothetical protein
MFGWLAMVAATLGLLLLFIAPGSDSASSAAPSLLTTPLAYSGWAVGVGTGLVLAWLLRVDWATVPARFGLWIRLQRRRLGWALVGAFFAGILLLY